MKKLENENSFVEAVEELIRLGEKYNELLLQVQTYISDNDIDKNGPELAEYRTSVTTVAVSSMAAAMPESQSPSSA